MTSRLIPDPAGVADALDRGQVLLLNTDTLPGLHARLDRPAALAALAALKGRADDKPLLVLAASEAEALSLAAPLDARWLPLLTACWPGPFTFVLAAGAGLPRAVCSATETVAIRVPDRGPLQRLLALTGPLASTSANLAGQAAATSLDDARARFAGLAAWDDGALAPEGAASALVALIDDAPRVLRPGPRPLPRFAADA
jgi:L-threonylcarbamoyladenylate synthase